MRIRRWFYAYGEVRTWIWVTAISLLTVFILWVFSAGIYAIAVNNGRNQCRGYSEATLRDTKYVKTAFLSWECFVRVDGQWVLKQQVWTNGEGN